MTKKAYVIGHPIAHSKSPIIHGFWLEKHKIKGGYETLDVHPDTLSDTVHNLRNDLSCAGFNVTIPHKQAIMPFLDQLDDAGRATHAVNTVYRNPDNSKEWIGSNTDAFGFIENLKESVSRETYEAAKNKPVWIWGAGGASYAVLYGLQKEGFSKFFISNRTRAKSEMLVQKIGKKECCYEIMDSSNSAINPDAGLYINTTSLGMSGQNPFNPDISELNPDAILVDIVYNPLYTDFLRAGQARQLQIVTGIGMLLHQARPAFEYFFGTMPKIDKKLEILLKGE